MQADTINSDDFMSEAEAAEFLKVKPQTLRCWSARRQGPPRISVARRAIYRRAALLQWLASREVDYSALRGRAA